MVDRIIRTLTTRRKMRMKMKIMLMMLRVRMMKTVRRTHMMLMMRATVS